jgi:GNAT superfamily N-acetyltransferase
VAATPADQPAIHQFLVSVVQGPTVSEFQAQLEDPTYEPADRLLIKSGRTIVAHLRLVHREMHFGPLVLPVGIVTDVVTLPEYRCQGCATSLLEAARQILIHDGVMLGLLRTELPRFYARRGWVVWGRHCYSAAGPREILSHLRLREGEQATRTEFPWDAAPRPTYNIRLWRQVERAALIRLYGLHAEHAHGALVRTEPYWQWLIRRGGHERVYVAINGPDKLELDESLHQIVAYAATHEGRIVETMCAGEHPEAALQLLARACGDAIEQDIARIQVDAPPGDPLHTVLRAAGGQYRHHEADNGLVFMANLFKPRAFLKLVSHQLQARVREAGLRRPCQLGMRLPDDKYRLEVTRRNVRLLKGSLGRSYLSCSRYDVAQLLLGHLDLPEAIASGRIAVSTRVAQELATTLLPRLPLWRPPWDELPAA